MEWKEKKLIEKRIRMGQVLRTFEENSQGKDPITLTENRL